QLTVGNVAVLVCIRAARIFDATDPRHNYARMAADGALPCVRGIALTVELHERAQERLDPALIAIIALERLLDLGRHIAAAGRPLGIFGIAKVLCAAPPVREIRDAV